MSRGAAPLLCGQIIAIVGALEARRLPPKPVHDPGQKQPLEKAVSNRAAWLLGEAIKERGRPSCLTAIQAFGMEKRTDRTCEQKTSG